MNRLFTGIATIALVGVVVAGATVAFYNDTETSTGNIFTAGSIDLKVDHLKQSYNGEDCTTLCSHWAVSVEEFTQGNRQDGSDVLLGRSNPTDALGPNDTSGLNPDVPFPTGFVSLGFGGSITLHFPDGIDDGPGDVPVLRLEGVEQDQRDEGRPLPDVDDHHREQRRIRVGVPQALLQAHALEQIVEQAADWLEHGAP